MQWIIKIYEWFLDLWNPPYKTIYAEESLPKRLHNKAIYIIQEDGFFENAAMICPCGCNKTLYMNLIPDERPCWKVTKHTNGTATLYPSVWRKKECGSHFWFREGRVHWC